MRSEAATSSSGLPPPPASRQPFDASSLATLTDTEVLGLLLAGGRPQANALSRAARVLAECGGLAALHTSSPSMLRYLGLPSTQAAALRAACELACRLLRERIPDPLQVDGYPELARFLSLRYGLQDQEVMGALFLDSRRRLLGHAEIFRGTLHRAAVEPRQILKECLLRSAAAVILFHTHPSGDPTPSQEDHLFTRRIVEAAEVIGVDLLDHIVVGGSDRWSSIRGRVPW